MAKQTNIYKILKIIREDQRRFDRTVADLNREKDAIRFLASTAGLTIRPKP